MAKKALMPAQLRKQMKAARKGVHKAADAIVKAYLKKFNETVLPDFRYDGDCYVWDIDYDDDEQNKQVVWLEDAGLYPVDCPWLWW